MPRPAALGPHATDYTSTARNEQGGGLRCERTQSERPGKFGHNEASSLLDEVGGQ